MNVEQMSAYPRIRQFLVAYGTDILNMTMITQFCKGVKSKGASFAFVHCANVSLFFLCAFDLVLCPLDL